VVNAVLLRPLPFPDARSVVTIFHVPPAAAFPGVKTFEVSPVNYLDWRKQHDLFESISVFNGRTLRICRTRDTRSDGGRGGGKQQFGSGPVGQPIRLSRIAGESFGGIGDYTTPWLKQ